MSKKYDVITIFWFMANLELSQSRILDAWSIILICFNENLLSNKNWKQNWKIFNTNLPLLLWATVLLVKKLSLRGTKIATSGKLWHYRLYFLELHIYVCLRIKFQFYLIIPTSFRQLEVEVTILDSLTVNETPQKTIQVRVDKIVLSF